MTRMALANTEDEVKNKAMIDLVAAIFRMRLWFADLEDFTKMASGATTEDLVGMTRELWSIADEHGQAAPRVVGGLRLVPITWD